MLIFTLLALLYVPKQATQEDQTVLEYCTVHKTETSPLCLYTSTYMVYILYPTSHPNHAHYLYSSTFKTLIPNIPREASRPEERAQGRGNLP